MRIVLGFQVVDRLLFDFQFLQMADEAFPVLFAFLTLGQVQLGYQFLGALQRNILAILVVVLDDILLVSGMLSHGVVSGKV